MKDARKVEDNAGVIPFEDMPGIPPIFLAFTRGEAAEFFPDPPTVAAVVDRARALSGGPVPAVATGQQAGLFTGPLYSLTKALGAQRLAAAVAEAGAPARPVFWLATEDHDLAEVARATVSVEGAPRTFEMPDPSWRPFAPAGGAPVPAAVAEIFEAISRDGSAPEPVDRFRQIWRPGRTYAEAFVETFRWLLPGPPIEIVDPLDPRWREAKGAFFARAVARAEEIVAAPDEVERRLKLRGHSPQVSRVQEDFPCFLLIEGVRRKLSWKAGTFRVHGQAETFSAQGLLAWARERGAEPSPGALLRPVLQAWLFPVAAQVLGPSELAYHAQTRVLFSLFDREPPVFVPRPHLLPRGARERRAIEALGLSERAVFRAREAARGEPPAVAARLSRLEESFARDLLSLEEEVAALDSTLVAALRQAVEKAVHPVARLREKLERAAERRDLEKNRRIETVENWLTPGGSPADRVYTPLTYAARFGPEWVAALAAAADCRVDGARFVELE